MGRSRATFSRKRACELCTCLVSVAGRDLHCTLVSVVYRCKSRDFWSVTCAIFYVFSCTDEILRSFVSAQMGDNGVVNDWKLVSDVGRRDRLKFVK